MNPNRVMGIIEELKPHFEESMLAGDRTKIWLPTDLYERYRQHLIDFWDEASKHGAYGLADKSIADGGLVLFRGVECIPREAEDEATSK